MLLYMKQHASLASSGCQGGTVVRPMSPPVSQLLVFSLYTRTNKWQNNYNLLLNMQTTDNVNVYFCDLHVYN